MWGLGLGQIGLRFGLRLKKRKRVGWEVVNIPMALSISHRTYSTSISTPDPNSDLNSTSKQLTQL